MDRVSPGIVDRIVEDLRASGAIRSSGALARDHLGLGLLDESVAARLLDPVLAEDPRLTKTDGGWRADVDSGGADAAGAGPRLDAPHRLVAAPLRDAGPAAAQTRGAEPTAAYVVSVGGREEVAAYRRAEGGRDDLPVIGLAQLARRLRGYRGPADPFRIAEVLGICHVQSEGIEGWIAVLAACWDHLRAELAEKDILDIGALDRLMEARLEAASFRGKLISPEQLRNLPDQPGVYVFRDDRGRPLYVGQSGNLEARVTSYFCGPPRDDKDRALRRYAHSLEVQVVDSGLDAWIAELRAIRRLRPRLNKRRQVLEQADDDGWLLVPDPAQPGRGVLFALWRGRLAERGVIPAARGRQPAAVARVLEGSGRLLHRADAAESGSLAIRWSRTHPSHPFLRLGIDGAPAQIERALLAWLEDLNR